MTYNEFIQSKIAFIHEFMNSTRPASELNDFIKAFDSINLNVCDIPDPTPPKDFQITSSLEHQDEPAEAEKPVAKRSTKPRKTITINNGTTMNVHPSSKLVKVSFFDRDTYYVSSKAAARAIGVSTSSVSRAIKLRKLINGHKVEFVNSSELMAAPKTE